MALPQARITPTLKEKRYNTLNFLEASVMGGNKVGISQVDNYKITDLSGELFTYKEPIETYITFDQRPSVKLLQKYGWYRDEQEVSPIIAYIPTHLLYDMDKLIKHTNFTTNNGNPDDLNLPNYSIHTTSEDLKYIVYYRDNDLNTFEIYNQLEHDSVLTNALKAEIGTSTVTNIVITEREDYILISLEEDGSLENRIYHITHSIHGVTIEQQIAPNEFTTAKLYSARFLAPDKLVVTTAGQVLLYQINFNTFTFTLLHETNTGIRTIINDVMGDLILLQQQVLTHKGVQIYRIESNKLNRLSVGLETIGLEKGRISLDGKTITLLDSNQRLRVYKVIKNTLKQLFIIPVKDYKPGTINLEMNNTYIYVTGELKSRPGFIEFKAYEYNDETYINHANLDIDLNIFPNIGDTTILIPENNNSKIYLLDSINGAYAEISMTNEDNYAKAVANYTLLTGEDMGPLVEYGESDNYILEPLYIQRGALIDIKYGYDFIDIEHNESIENLFYVTDVKVDTISINYVANLMPYKYDNPNEGEPDSNIVEFRGDTRDAGLK